jgi:hypothetical protein
LEPVTGLLFLITAPPPPAEDALFLAPVNKNIQRLTLSMAVARSKIVTLTVPYLASAMAQVSPDMPAPTMTTFSILFGLKRESMLALAS